MESPAVPAASTSASVASPWWVVCLCAQWCGTCRDYRAVFDQLARAHPAVRFVWIDIEDDAEVAGDLDVETFPTLLLADGQVARFLGPLLPQAAVLSRLLESLQSRSGHLQVDALAQAVFDRVRAAND
ncbi:MAG TPA: thioredoxin family protein [Rhodoferax sp.]|nr:thioredoxin family protein [Rhodoferax sp.]